VGYVDANGVHIYCAEHASGEPLLLLHGGLVDGDRPTMTMNPIRRG
jgi:hypothetical protein